MHERAYEFNMQRYGLTPDAFSDQFVKIADFVENKRYKYFL